MMYAGSKNRLVQIAELTKVRRGPSPGGAGHPEGLREEGWPGNPGSEEGGMWRQGSLDWKQDDFLTITQSQEGDSWASPRRAGARAPGFGGGWLESGLPSPSGSGILLIGS